MARVDEYIIKLQQQASGAAATAAAMNALEAQIRAESEAMAGLTSDVEEAKAALEALGRDASIEMVAKHMAALQEARAKLAAQQIDFDKLTGARGIAEQIDAQTRHNKATQEAKRIAGEHKAALAAEKQAQAEETAELTKALGPLGGYVGKLSSVASVSGMAMTALLAMVAAVVAATAAAVAGAVALTQYAIAAADAARSSRLLADAAAGTRARGSELDKVISDIATRVPIAREKVAEFGRQLELAGVTGARMQVALEMIAAIESAVPGAGAKIEGLIERFQRLRRATLTRADLVGTGLAIEDVAAQVQKALGISQQAAIAMLQNGSISVDKMAEYMGRAVEAKFGKTVAAQMMSLSVQFAKLKESFAALFTGLDLEPFLAGLREVTDLFSQNTVTGRVLRQVLTLALQPVVNLLAAAMPYARQFFLGLAIGALQFYIALKPTIKALRDVLGEGDKAKTLAMAFHLGRLAVTMLGLAIQVVIEGLTGFAAIVQTVGAAWDWIKEAYAKLDAFGKWLAGLGPRAAAGLVDGLVGGIMAGVAAVASAAGNLGAAIEQGLRDALGWHSPATLGVDAIGGVVQGMEKGADDGEARVSKAVDKTISPQNVKAMAKGSGGAKVLYIEHFHGTQDALADLRAMLRGEFEFEEVAVTG